MKTTSRMVIDADPHIRQMLEELKLVQGKTMKEIVQSLIDEEYKRMKESFL